MKLFLRNLFLLEIIILFVLTSCVEKRVQNEEQYNYTKVEDDFVWVGIDQGE